MLNRVENNFVQHIFYLFAFLVPFAVRLIRDGSFMNKVSVFDILVRPQNK